MSPEPEKPKKHAILLVDDEPEILYSLKALLRREFDLYTAESAQEALEILKQHKIHVIMTDQRMPEMTGVELLGRAHAEFPSAMRIVFTGYADIKAVVDAINTGGVYRYIVKPWDPDDLIDVLKDAAARYDDGIERGRLLHDTRTFLQEWRELGGRLGETDLDAEIRGSLEAGQQLLDRLSRILPT